MPRPKISRRDALKMAGAASAGVGVFMGPWKHVHVFGAATDKPIKIGLTHDASGQFGASGQSEKRGTIMAIEEVNAKGGVLGRKMSTSGRTPRRRRRPARAWPSA